jgi:hypothetical protein
VASNNKFLVNLIHSLTDVSHRHVFLLAWVGISAFFAFLMVQSYRRSVQRNFRRPGEPAGRPPGRASTPALKAPATQLTRSDKKKS